MVAPDSVAFGEFTEHAVTAFAVVVERGDSGERLVADGTMGLASSWLAAQHVAAQLFSSKVRCFHCSMSAMRSALSSTHCSAGFTMYSSMDCIR